MAETFKNSTEAPCFDYRYFKGVGQLIINDEMAKLFASELRRSGSRDQMIESLARDLEGDEDNELYPDPEEGWEPFYDFTYFRGQMTVSLNKPAAKLVADALGQSNLKTRIHPALWTLQTEVSKFYKKPSSAISQAAHKAWKLATVDGDKVIITKECYDALNTVFDRPLINSQELRNRIETEEPEDF